MAVIQAVVYDNLTAIEVGMTERGRYVNDRAGLEALGLLSRDKALQVCHCVCKECCVARANQHRTITVCVAARIEGHHDQFLSLEPIQGICLALCKVITVNILKARLVGRLVITDAHAVGIATAHVILGVVDDYAVLCAYYGRFTHLTAACYVIYDIVLTRTAGTEYRLVQLLLAGGYVHALALVQ